MSCTGPGPVRDKKYPEKTRGGTREKIAREQKCDPNSPENLRYVKSETADRREKCKKNSNSKRRRRETEKKEPRDTQTSQQDKPGTAKDASGHPAIVVSMAGTTRHFV